MLYLGCVVVRLCWI